MRGKLQQHHVDDSDLRKGAKHLHKCKRVTWRRWSSKNLHGVRERHRMLHGRESIVPKVGEVVIIPSDEKNRNKRTLGIIDSPILGFHVTSSKLKNKELSIILRF